MLFIEVGQVTQAGLGCVRILPDSPERNLYLSIDSVKMLRRKLDLRSFISKTPSIWSWDFEDDLSDRRNESVRQWRRHRRSCHKLETRRVRSLAHLAPDGRQLPFQLGGRGWAEGGTFTSHVSLPWQYGNLLQVSAETVWGSGRCSAAGRKKKIDS